MNTCQHCGTSGNHSPGFDCRPKAYDTRDERRDFFVRAALQGLCAQAGLPGTPEHKNAPTVAEDIAKWATLIADATLHEIYIHPLSHPPRELHTEDCQNIRIYGACTCR